MSILKIIKCWKEDFTHKVSHNVVISMKYPEHIYPYFGLEKPSGAATLWCKECHDRHLQKRSKLISKTFRKHLLSVTCVITDYHTTMHCWLLVIALYLCYWTLISSPSYRLREWEFSRRSNYNIDHSIILSALVPILFLELTLYTAGQEIL